MTYNMAKIKWFLSKPVFAHYEFLSRSLLPLPQHDYLKASTHYRGN